jgi:pimeloyl-ACP methyl ester carboxylesterase
MSKPELLLVHGMSGTPVGWENYRRVFEARGYRVHAPALRYHDRPPGDVPHPELATTSLLDYVDDLAQLIGSLPSKPIVIGHSMGGLLSLMLAGRGLVRGAVLLTPGAPAGINAITWSVLRIGWRTLTTWGFWRKPVIPRYAESRWGVFNNVDETEAKRLFADMVPDSGRVAFEIGFANLDRRRASRVDPASISCPLLVVGASKDRMTPASVIRKIAARYAPHSTYMEFADHAHWILGEPGWEIVAGQVVDWIEAQAPVMTAA